MGSPFRDAALTASLAVDAVYGERMRIVPMKRGQYAGSVPDPDRTVREIVGVPPFETLDRIKATDSHAKVGRDFDTRFVGAVTVASIDPREFAAGGLPCTGDHLVCLDRDDEPVFVIGNVEAPLNARVVLTLTKLAPAA